jgi:hypothetical protein
MGSACQRARIQRRAGAETCTMSYMIMSSVPPACHVCMYVCCMYVHMYACTYACMYVKMWVYTRFVCLWSDCTISVCIKVYACACTYDAYVCICSTTVDLAMRTSQVCLVMRYAWRKLHTYMHAYIHAYIPTYIPNVLVQYILWCGSAPECQTMYMCMGYARAHVCVTHIVCA